MERAVMISIHPKWCELIASGKKTIEVRKTRPKIETPFKCYIYATKNGRPLVWGSCMPSYVEESLVQTYGYSKERADEIFGIWNGKVIGEFICDDIHCYTSTSFIVKEDAEKALNGTCMTKEELYKYLDWHIGVSRYQQRLDYYAWHISSLKIYDEPKELFDFRTVCKYRNGDGSCQYQKIECYGTKFDFNQDYSVNLAICMDAMSRPPQSWCYVDFWKENANV